VTAVATVREHWTAILRLCSAHPSRKPAFFELHFGERVRILGRVKATVIVMPKASVLDPQGVAVRDAVHHHGLPEVRGVRIGKIMEIESDDAIPAEKLHAICRDLLSNPVIEDYRLLGDEPAS
jgi:phosphoribosylformylglycinamidine synthase PurS subunit